MGIFSSLFRIKDEILMSNNKQNKNISGRPLFSNEEQKHYHKIAYDNHRNEKRTLCENACLSRDAIRRFREQIPDKVNIRPAFSHDADRIIHCNAYTRYIDKTQVFWLVSNDHITHRVLHVQIVSKIARTIGRCLGLNLDLIEAIALGHDLGHTPFGHAGEEFLAEIMEEKNAGSFIHNAQSVRLLDKLEGDNPGLNISLQVLDGILGHNGEMLKSQLKPSRGNLKWDILDNNLKACLDQPRKTKPEKHILPSTLEGCVVRIADVISYIGRDFEDAITLKLIGREDLPEKVKNTFGTENREIVNTIILDIISRSKNQAAIVFSDEVFNALEEMKSFNYEKIYCAPIIQYEKRKLKRLFSQLFDDFEDDLKSNRCGSPIFIHFLNDKPATYIENETPQRIVADFISSMTDRFFLDTYAKQLGPLEFGRDFTSFTQTN